MDFENINKLHSAVDEKNLRKILKLMKGGAFLCDKNQYNETALHKMSPELLGKILNQKIHREKPGFSVNFDFLRRPIPQSTNNDLTPPEMILINEISKNNTLRPLLSHIVPETFINLKWRKFSTIINLYFAFLVARVVLLTTPKNDIIDPKTGIYCLLVRHLFLAITSPKRLFNNLTNFLELNFIIVILTTSDNIILSNYLITGISYLAWFELLRNANLTFFGKILNGLGFRIDTKLNFSQYQVRLLTKIEEYLLEVKNVPFFGILAKYYLEFDSVSELITNINIDHFPPTFLEKYLKIIPKDKHNLYKSFAIVLDEMKDAFEDETVNNSKVFRKIRQSS